MTTSRHMTTVALAAAMLFGHATSALAASARAEITGLRFELIDLAPDDGIAPSFDLGGLTGFTEVVGNPSFSFTDIHAQSTYQSQTPGAESLASWNLDGGHLLADTRTFSPGPSDGFATVLFSAQDPGRVTLSANTRLAIQGTATLSITGDGYAAAGYRFFDQGGSAPPFAERNLELQAGDDATSKLLDLSYTIDNTSNAARSWEFYTYVRALAPAAAVPEPNALLLIAGAGAVLALTLRQRHLAQHPSGK